MDSPNIVVIEDRPAIAELLVCNLRKAGFVAVGTHNAAEGKVLVRTLHPDLILLDCQDADLRERPWLIEELRRGKKASFPLLILNEEGKATRSADNQTHFLNKPFSASELVARVRGILQQHPPLEPANALLGTGRLSLNRLTHRVSSGQTEIHLKPAEFRLLAFFMAHPERVFNRAQLLDAVWGNQTIIDERAVDVQIRRLRSALAPYGHSGQIETVRGAGYRLAEE
ncbi:MAG: Phosphate regulon transcriptional regulatory protein PhoB [Betaproteobacteria bacterium ADurb.Bin341]|nr:MAG: Phosphate regulon transcriptional regulatory protein PhoB [Betaproteobacteria bacterium ADurb.Bin341]